MAKDTRKRGSIETGYSGRSEFNRQSESTEPENQRSELNIKAILGSATLFLLGLIGLTIIFGSWYTIDATERGVVFRNGSIVGISDPGLHFKAPMIDSVVKLSTLTKSLAWDKIETYSKDQQPATLRISLNYHIPGDQVVNYYTQFGSNEEAIVTNLIGPRLLKDLKENFGQYTAADSIQKRAELGKLVQTAVDQSAAGRPIIIDGVQIEDISFSSAYETAVEARMQAEVQVAKAHQDALREKEAADQAFNKADGEARSIRAVADANAHAIEVRGKAEGTAIQARADALKNNPDLAKLTQAERWDGHLPVTMVPGSALPFLNMTPATITPAN